MCRAVLESGESQSAAEGINDGIMYLMIFPYLLMAGIAYFIWKSRKKARTEE
jgi:preprotein translocase subunit YajC